MGKIAKKSLHKNIISKGGGGGPLAPADGPWTPAREGGGIYSTRGGEGGKVMRSPGKKVLLYAGYFYYFSVCGGGGHFCYVFLFVGAARALMPVQMFVGGGGGSQAQKRPP